ncbi:MAG: hypothetical protein Kow0037_13130 [Calditrichia bacterium]
MKIQRLLLAGAICGLAMGITLFFAGAIFSRIIYGPQFAPAGKFDPEQLNAWYFIWTKLLIGLFFGILFTAAYQLLPLKHRFRSGRAGLLFGFLFWLVQELWNISHPLIYGNFSPRNELFWAVYTLSGFLMFGFLLGRFFARYEDEKSREQPPALLREEMGH